MVLIFVAKNDIEFKKYETALRPNEKNNCSWTLKQEKSSYNLEEMIDVNEGDDDKLMSEEDVLMDTPNEEKNRIDELKNHNIYYYHRTIEEKDLIDHVFVLKEIPKKEEAKNNDLSSVYVKAYMDIFWGLTIDIVGADIKEKDIYVFIHWGTVSPSKYEKIFREKIVATKSHQGINTFAISSTRPKLFDVNGDKIYLPNTRKEITDIITRFSYDMVKDIFSEYIWDRKVSLDNSKLNKVNYFLTNLLYPCLKDREMKEDVWIIQAIKRWEDFYESCELEKDKPDKATEDKQYELKEDKHLVALFSYLILNEGTV